MTFAELEYDSKKRRTRQFCLKRGPYECVVFSRHARNGLADHVIRERGGYLFYRGIPRTAGENGIRRCTRRRRETSGTSG